MSKRKSDDSSTDSNVKRPALAPLFAPRATNKPLPRLPNNPLALPKTNEGELKVATWNVCGLESSMSVAKKLAFRKYVEAEDPDVLVITEVEWARGKNSDELEFLKPLYPYRYWQQFTAIWSKVKPASVTVGFPDWAESNKEGGAGRYITLEFSKTFLVGAYVQNAGPLQKPEQQLSRQKYNRDTQRFFLELKQRGKDLIWVGDFNVIPTKLDIAKVSQCWDEHPGCYKFERDDFSALLQSCNLVDAFRFLHPTAREYTHTGPYLGEWRLDGYVLSRELLHRVNSCTIRHDVHKHFASASDHWPIVLILEDDL